MAVTFRTDVLEILLPHLKDRLFHEDWEQRESGILALGAIAEGEFVFPP
jgi:transportin-1